MKEEDLLYELHKSKDVYKSGEDLAHHFGVSRTSIWNYIDYFRKQGYSIEAHPNLGYRLIDVPDRILPDEIKYGLDNKIIGRRIYAYEEITSTNDIAQDLALKGEQEGSVVFAESQIKGRGRLQRNWFSPKRKGLWFSLILRPQLAPNYIPLITAMSAVAVAKAISSYTGLTTWIKWPNDIYINGKKAGGILTEITTDIDAIRFVILGIGINVNIDNFNNELEKKATSLRIEGKQNYSRVELAKKILISLEHYYSLLTDKKWDEIINEWKSLSFVLGKRVSLVYNGEHIEGQAMGLDEYGALILRMDDGFLKHITAGEVLPIER
jgi:BirA family biotin operon repressor/biotin-[acetyl-CoA-carboxylase] ligase